MFERFTEHARQVVVLAQEESRTLRHNYIGTEHLLLGLLREDEGLASELLRARGIGIEKVRSDVLRIAGRGKEISAAAIPFKPRAKEALQFALEEGIGLGDSYIDTEHLLLGLARVQEGLASRLLVDYNVTAEKLRADVVLLRERGRSRRPRKQPRREEHERAYAIKIGLDQRVRRAMKLGTARALTADHDEVEPLDLLHALLADETVESLLADLGIDRDALRAAIEGSDQDR
jgi:ATP-dependent Clp protease ATP-binding subunit ClpA